MIPFVERCAGCGLVCVCWLARERGWCVACRAGEGKGKTPARFCRRGHDQEREGRVSPGGQRYCLACRRAMAERRKDARGGDRAGHAA